MDTKLMGDISVHMLVVELLRLEYAVLVPVGDRLPYDVAVEREGKLIRIQVRTAYFDERRDIYVGNVRSARTNRKQYAFVKSNTKDVEFFVFVVQNLRVFYIIPSAIIDGIKSSVSLTPHRTRREDRFNTEQYKDNWELINK